MAKKRPKTAGTTRPRSFTGVIKGRSKPVRDIAQALRQLVFEELPNATESFYGGQRPMAMYRTTADVCWIQPLQNRCNMYFMRSQGLSDKDGILEGKSDRFRFVKVGAIEDTEHLPLRDWLKQTVQLNSADAGIGFEEVHQKMKGICLSLPNTKETETWGKPHFRVGEKIFCGCGENQGAPRIGLKMEPDKSEIMMRVPGIEKAPYSRKGDGWVSIDPREFDDWEEIENLIVGSFCLIAPKRVSALLKDRQPAKGQRKKR